MPEEKKSKIIEASADKLLHCSFCGKDRDTVDLMVAGLDSNICDLCLDVCNEILEAHRKKNTL